MSLIVLAGAVSALGCAVFAGFVAGLWYSRYYRDGGENTGQRAWPWFRRSVARLLTWSATDYLQYTLQYASPDVEELVKHSDSPALFCGHPHGVVAIGSLCHLTALNQDNERWLSVVPCVHGYIFNTPLVREFALWFGARDVTRDNIERLLTEENVSVYLTPGGTREMIDPTVVQRRHTGFLRIAFKLQRPVFPVLHRGQEAVFPHYSNAWLDRARDLLCDWTGYPFPSFFLGPFRAPLSTVIYAPLQPAAYESEEAFVDAYYAAVERHWSPIATEVNESALEARKKGIWLLSSIAFSLPYWWTAVESLWCLASLFLSGEVPGAYAMFVRVWKVFTLSSFLVAVIGNRGVAKSLATQWVGVVGLMAVWHLLSRLLPLLFHLAWGDAVSQCTAYFIAYTGSLVVPLVTADLVYRRTEYTRWFTDRLGLAPF